MTPLLEIAGLTKRFGGLAALDGLDLAVAEGEIVSVIGPNGAGKTTLFNTMTGLYGPDQGDVRFEGQSVVGLKPNQITRLGISRRTVRTHLERLFGDLGVHSRAAAVAIWMSTQRL